MVAGRPSPAPLGPVYPAGSALGGGWGLLWPYRSTVVGWCLDAVTATFQERHTWLEADLVFLIYELWVNKIATG